MSRRKDSGFTIRAFGKRNLATARELRLGSTTVIITSRSPRMPEMIVAWLIPMIVAWLIPIRPKPMMTIFFIHIFS